MQKQNKHCNLLVKQNDIKNFRSNIGFNFNRFKNVEFSRKRNSKNDRKKT